MLTWPWAAGFCIAGCSCACLAWLWLQGWRRGESQARVSFWVTVLVVAAASLVVIATRGESFRSGWLTASGIALVGIPAGLWLTQPLGDEGIARIARARRRRLIRTHFRRSSRVVLPDASFKSSLKPDGQLYSASIDLADFPSYAAQLLKYKKHEWMVVGFACGREVVALWAHKGPDSSQVLCLPTEEVLGVARRLSADTVMAFHNHPASEPHRYDYSRPST